MAESTSSSFEPEQEVKICELFFENIALQQNLINELTTNADLFMTAVVNCLKFNYMGITRYVVCDIGSRYEQIQKLASKAFCLADECIPAIQFTDGKSYHFSKEIFENYILLFPQPEQQFYVRLDVNKIKYNSIVVEKGERIRKNKNNECTHIDTIDVDDVLQMKAAPLKRSNCFLGTLPESDSGTKVDHGTPEQQPRKRRRLIDSIKKTARKIVRKAPVQRVLRI